MPLHERRPVGEERPNLGRGQAGKDRAPARGEGRGQPDADVADQRRASRRALLEDVEHVASVQHGQVGTVAGAVDQSHEGPAREALQGLLAGVSAADLEGRDAQPVAMLVGEVGDKPSSIIVPMRWYAVERGRPTARAIRSSGTGSVWLARKRRTRSARAAAGTWLIATLPVVLPPGHRRHGVRADSPLRRGGFGSQRNRRSLMTSEGRA